MVSSLSIRFFCSVCFAVALGCATFARSAPLRLYVAPDGRDTWSGTLARANAAGDDGPFATPGRALERIGAEKAKRGQAFEGVVVTVRQGVYRLAGPLAFDTKNCGLPGAPVVFRVLPGETAVLSGGRRIADWQRGQHGVFRARLDAGVATGKANWKLLYCNGRRMHLARWPNAVPGAPICGGWAFVAGDPIPMYAETGGDKVTLALRDRDVRRTWSHPAEGEVVIFPRYNWWNNILPIKNVDWNRKLLITARPASFQMRPGDRYFVQGIREELDAPEEWYLDSKERVLLFRPPAGIDPATAEVVLSRLPVLVDVRRAGYVRFEGFVFEHAELWGVRAREAEHVEICRCTLRHIGSRCEWNSAGIFVIGNDNQAVGNDIYDVGSKGIFIQGGDRVTLEPGNNVAENNYIHHTGVIAKSGSGIRVMGVGNRVSRNYIHDTPRDGIAWNGNDHVIEGNHIRHTNTEISDTAMINACNANWVKRGTVVRWNYLHDPIGFGKNRDYQWVQHYYCWAIYLDNWTSGTHVYGNICVRVPRGLAHNHGGRDNLIENNVAIDGTDYQFSWQSWKPRTPEQAARIDNDLETYAPTAPYAKYPGLKAMLAMSREERYRMSGVRLERNIFCYRADTTTFLVHDLPFESTVSNRNLFWHYGRPLSIRHRGWQPAESWEKWLAAGFEKDSHIAPPGFVDPDHDDYRLRPDSPARALGFKTIPVEKIGCYASKDRASWPIVDAPGVREHPLQIGLMPKPPVKIYPRPSFAVPRKKPHAEIVIDGDLEKDWPAHIDFRHGITMKALVGGGTSPRPSYAYIVYDARYLYIGIKNRVNSAKPLKTAPVWNRNDAVEVALRTPRGDVRAPVFVLRGFPDGSFISSTEAGAPEDRAADLKHGTRYAAKIRGRGEWDAEWRVPLATLGVPPLPDAGFDCNLTCRKTADDEWVMWNATRGSSWKVSRAGILTLKN